MVLWKETAFPLCKAMERRWKRNVVSRVSSVIVVIRQPISCELNGHLMPCTSCLYGKWVEDVIIMIYSHQEMHTKVNILISSADNKGKLEDPL